VEDRPEELAGLRILIVEDDRLVGMLASITLNNLGCALVGVAETVEEALDAVQKGGIDGALLET
jgi:CheY-like chemotaxis protein